MTLNPTSPYLELWDRDLKALGLEKVEPRVPVLSELRSMHVLPEIAKVLSGGTTSGFPSIRADTQNTIFSAGQFTTVSLLGDPQKKRPNLERLDGLDEAWAVCYRSPKPGWRILGRWVALNVFVGTRLWDRHSLKSRKSYGEKAQEMIDDWQTAFPSLAVVRGQTIADYVTGRVRDVDNYTF